MARFRGNIESFFMAFKWVYTFNSSKVGLFGLSVVLYVLLNTTTRYPVPELEVLRSSPLGTVLYSSLSILFQ